MTATVEIVEQGVVIEVSNAGIAGPSGPALAQISDINDVNISSPTDGQALTYDNVSGGWVNTSVSLTEVNDLTATVTWADVPDANITETSVTQHQAAISITESQISDLQVYALDADVVKLTGAQTIAGDKEFTADLIAPEFIGDLRGAVIFKAQAGEALSIGDVVYISGISGNTTVVSKADADDPTKMSAFGVASSSAALNQPVDVYTFGTLGGLDTSTPGWSIGDELYVSTTAGTLQNSPPAGESAAIQKVAKVTKVDAATGSIKILGAGRSNATPNLNDGNIFLGNASNQAVTTSLDTAVSTAGYIKNANLSLGTTTATDQPINIDQGTDVTLVPATTSLAGLMSAADKTKLDGVDTNANNYTHPDHTGDVTSTGDGATVIADNAVTLAKFQDIATDSFIGRSTAATGDPEVLSIATAKGMLDLTGTNSGDQTITLTGDVTGSGTGSFAATISDGSVTYAKMQDVSATDRLLGRDTAGAGDVEELTPASVRTMINVEDGATADQTGAEIKSLYEAEADTNAYTDAEQTKVGHLTVTQAVDLDAIETRVNELDAAVILMGTFQPSLGSFPGGGSAQAGESWIASDTGTIDGVAITQNDRVIAITDNASTTTYASNWHLADYTDLVQSVVGQTGVVTAAQIEAAVNHDNLTGFVANEHIDWTADQGATDINAGNISEASVTQHQAALSITESQISDLNHAVDVVSNVATSTILGRTTAGSGDSEELTPASVRTLLNVEDGATADQTDAEIRAAVEAATDSNVFTDADHSKLNGISANANNYSHPDHTGEVTSSSDGATTLTVSAITNRTALTTGIVDADELLINDGGVLKRTDVSVLGAYMQASLDHDSFQGFVANEHIDWTADQGATDINAGNISESSVTQHQAALSITESQISDLAHYSYTANVETLSADKTLTNSDAIVQILNPNGAARNVDLPAEEANLRFIIKNNQSASSANTLTIRDDAGVALNLVLGAEQACEVISDGTSWFVTRTPQSHELSATGGLSLGSNSKAVGDQALAVGIGASSGSSHGVSLGSGAQSTGTEGIGIGRLAFASATGAVSIGGNSDATQDGAIAIGDTAQGLGTDAVVIGHSATSNQVNAVAVGRAANAGAAGSTVIGSGAAANASGSQVVIGVNAAGTGSGAISIGQQATNAGDGSIAIGDASDATVDGSIAIGDTAQATAIGSIALGDSSTADRASETAVNITGAATQDYARGSIGLQASTTTATPAELLCGGNAGERITIDADSVMVFEAMITGRDNTANEICAYKFSGVIKRDAANNTTLVQSNREIITEENASFDCTVAADDTNEALVFTVTATGTNATRWVGVVDYSEAKF